MPKLRLGINIDHVATIRNARKRHALATPDLVRACDAAIAGGADSITFHLREDRRHVMDDDVKRMIAHLKSRGTPVNLEMAATAEMVMIAKERRPEAICLVPEKRREVTTEGGLDAVKSGDKLAAIVNDLAASGARVSLFINPDVDQVMAAYVSGAGAIELHTGTYCDATGARRARELKRLQKAAFMGSSLGLQVHAGHGLNYENVSAVAAIDEIEELNIGHSLIGEAIFKGLEVSVREMKNLIRKSRA